MEVAPTICSLKMISGRQSRRLVIYQNMDSPLEHLIGQIQLVLVDVSFQIAQSSMIIYSIALTVTSNWNVHQKKVSKTANDVDYKKLNKLASKQRVTTCSDSYRFRQSAKKVVVIPDKTPTNPLHNRKPSA